NTEFYVLSKNLIVTVFLCVCGLWFWRFFKTIVMTQDFVKFIEDSVKHFDSRDPAAAFTRIIEPNRDPRIHNPHTLRWTSRPGFYDDSALRRSRDELDYLTKVLGADDPQLRETKENVYACLLILYIKQFFVHGTSLVVGLSVASVLLFLAASSFP